jgi:hypothetical protein
MPTFMQVVERLRSTGTVPTSGSLSIESLLKQFKPSPSGSVRALQAKMLDGVSVKAPWAVILCRFKDEPVNLAVEWPIEQAYRAWFGSGTGGIVEYWRDASLGMIDISASRVFGWTEVDMRRGEAAKNPRDWEKRRIMIDAAVAAVKRNGFDAVTGFYSQMAIYNQNQTVDSIPPGANANDYMIDGGAYGHRVLILPPHEPFILTHEMAHGFGMNHDLGPNLVTHYQDPCCTMSQMNPFVHPVWNVPFGPAICTPHLMQKAWMFPRRVYTDDGSWMSRRGGIHIPLAPITSPIDKANLAIKLPFNRGGLSFDYYIEYVTNTGWNLGLLRPYVFIRRMAPFDGGETPAILGLIDMSGASGEWIEPAGNVRFKAERLDVDGRVLKMSAEKL